ncbi:unnamed protein product [Mesocestoides corti]|uniref:Uncharacterized protein n=1 Tax=Mesocestoides corti TaxID=53468 RepID=A0A0R3ULK3_MESCO|nr:unnamed protein product [Mesocestoides corti]
MDDQKQLQPCLDEAELAPTTPETVADGEEISPPQESPQQTHECTTIRIPHLELENLEAACSDKSGKKIDPRKCHLLHQLMDLLVKLKQNAREDSCDADEAAPCCDDRPESMALKQRLSNPCQSTRGGCGQPTSQCNCKSVTCTCASAAEPVKPAIKEDKEPSIHEAEASTIEQTPPDHDAELDRPEAYESSLARLGRCESCPTMQRAESSCAEDKGPCKHAGGCADRRCRHMNPMSLGCGRPSSTMNCRNATIQTDVNGLDSKEDHSISCGVNTPVRLSKKRLSAATYPPKRSSRRSSDSAKVRSSGSKKSKFPSTHSRCSKRLRGSSHHTSAPSREPSTRKSSLQQSSPQHQASLSTSSLAESVSDEASKKTDEIVRSCLKQDRPCRQSSLDPADLASPLPPRNSFQHSSRASNESLQSSISVHAASSKLPELVSQASCGPVSVCPVFQITSMFTTVYFNIALRPTRVRCDTLSQAQLRRRVLYFNAEDGHPEMRATVFTVLHSTNLPQSIALFSTTNDSLPSNIPSSHQFVWTVSAKNVLLHASGSNSKTLFLMLLQLSKATEIHVNVLSSDAAVFQAALLGVSRSSTDFLFIDPQTDKGLPWFSLLPSKTAVSTVL